MDIQLPLRAASKGARAHDASSSSFCWLHQLPVHATVDGGSNGSAVAFEVYTNVTLLPPLTWMLELLRLAAGVTVPTSVDRLAPAAPAQYCYGSSQAQLIPCSSGVFAQYTAHVLSS